MDEGILKLSGLIKALAAEVEYGRVFLHGRIMQFIRAGDWPSMLEGGWVMKLLKAPVDFGLSFYIRPRDGETSQKTLSREIMKLETDKISFERDGRLVPESIVQKLRSNRKLHGEVISGSEKLHEVWVEAVVKGYTGKEIDFATKTVESVLNSQMIIPERINLELESALKGGMPLGEKGPGNSRILTSTALSACIPFLEPPAVMDKGGVFFGINEETNKPVILNPFRLLNPHLTVLGTSGAGKSYFINQLCGKFLQHPDVSVIIIDREGEYGSMSEAFNGEIISISPYSDTAINPFDLCGMNFTEKILSLHSFSHTLFESVTEAQRAMLDDGFYQVYAEKGITDDPRTWKNKPPILEDLYRYLSFRELDENADVKRSASAIARKLQPCTKGSMRFLNRQTNVNLTKRFVVFNLRGLSDAAVKPVIYLIHEYVMNRIEKNVDGRMVLINDEGWEVLQSQGGEVGKHIFRMARTGRKRATSLIIISQLVEDFLRRMPDGTIPGKAILGNCSTVFLLMQNESVLEDVRRTFNLNEKEMRRISKVGGIGGGGQGKGILIVENDRIPLRVITSPEEHERITSKKHDEKSAVKVQPEPLVFHTDEKVMPMEQLEESQVKDLLKQGYKILRDLGLSKAGRARYVILNETQESDEHFILSHFVYEEVKKYTGKCRRNFTREPDVTFTARDGRKIAVEVENRFIAKDKELMEYPEFAEKVKLIEKKYDETVWCLCMAKYWRKYKRIKLGKVCSRTEIPSIIKSYFEPEESTFSKVVEGIKEVISPEKNDERAES